MIEKKSFIPLSRFQSGESGSLPKTIEIAPSVDFGGESTIRLVAEATSLTKICGCQPSWFA